MPISFEYAAKKALQEWNERTTAQEQRWIGLEEGLASAVRVWERLVENYTPEQIAEATKRNERLFSHGTVLSGGLVELIGGAGHDDL